MPSFSFDKEKYRNMARSMGVQATLTQLQKDIVNWEYQAFEGEKGYQPEMWNSLEEVRKFSRELWEIALDQEYS